MKIYCLINLHLHLHLHLTICSLPFACNQEYVRWECERSAAEADQQQRLIGTLLETGTLFRDKLSLPASATTPTGTKSAVDRSAGGTGAGAGAGASAGADVVYLYWDAKLPTNLTIK